jgi:hypothetical protein
MQFVRPRSARKAGAITPERSDSGGRAKQGSGTNEKDVVDCEDQMQMNKRSLSWSRSLFIVPTVEARPWCVMGTLPTGSRSIALMPVGVAAARILAPMRIHKLVVRSFCTPSKNEAACAASPGRLGSLGQRYPVGSKKVTQLPPLGTTLLAPDPKDATSTTLELDELRSFVLKKANDSWVWIALCRQRRQVVADAVETEVKRPASACGRPLQTYLVLVTAFLISG